MISGGGPMNFMLQVSQTSAKLAFSRKQSVSGMDRVHVGDFRRADHSWNVQIALRELRRTNANRLIGEAYMQRIAVGLAVNCDRRIPSSLQAQITRRAISPRLAIRIFLNMNYCVSLNLESSVLARSRWLPGGG